MNDLVVLDAGRACVTDIGRHATGSGLSAYGALDEYSARAANALVGNDGGAALIEITLQDFAVAASRPTVMAVTGAVARVSIDGVAVPQWAPFAVGENQTVRVGGMSAGLRSYLAVLGSFDVRHFAGSCAPDPVLGFGGMLRSHDRIRLVAQSPMPAHPLFGHPLIRPPVEVPPVRSRALIDVTDGPHASQFGDTFERLFGAPFVMSARSDAVGVGMTGQPPERRCSDEILSFGVPVGAIEIPGGDQLIILHRGRGVTAGYPVPAVVTRVGLDRLAQLRPGESATFRRVTTADAIARYRAQRQALDVLRSRARYVLAQHGVAV